MKKLNIKKEVLDTIKFIGLLILIYFIIVLSFRYLPFLNRYSTFAIQTNSMEPVIDVGDVVITKRIPIDEIEIGDIMAFNVDINRDGTDDVVVHYIDEIIDLGDKLEFKTKPEISDLQDRWTIEEDDMIGRYQTQIPYVGKILLFAQSWIGKIIIIVDIIIISVVYDVLFGKKKDEKDSKEIEDTETENKEKVSTD